MEFESWRGTVGVIGPTGRPSIEDKLDLMPSGIHFVNMLVGITEGTAAEFVNVLDNYEDKARILSEIGVDYIHPSGAPPFMVHGFEGEQRIIGDWQDKYGVPMFTSGMVQVEAMKALGVTKIIGASYFRGEINETFAAYFRAAGIEVITIQGMDVDFNRAHFLNSREVYGFIRKIFLANRDADGIYMLGGAWSTLDIIDMLEQDMRVPVVHAGTARSWALQHRLHIRQPRDGLGQLLRDFPDPVVRLGGWLY